MVNRYKSLFFASLLSVSLVADVFMPFIENGFEHVVFLCDWDSVIADDKNGLSKLCSAIGTVPLKTSLPIMFKRLVPLIKILKNSRHDGQKLKGVALNVDTMIAQEPSLAPYRDALIANLNDAYPRRGMVEYLQSMHDNGIKVIIATNNDYESLVVKTAKLNANLAKKKMAPFVYDACFCAAVAPQIVNNRTPDGIPAGVVYGGKDTDEYFATLFKFVETEFGYNRSNTLFVFIDDLGKNINRARAVAKREGVKLCAVHRNRSDKRVIRQFKRAIHGNVYCEHTKLTTITAADGTSMRMPMGYMCGYRYDTGMDCKTMQLVEKIADRYSK